MKKRPVSDSESSYYESESDENESNLYYSDTELTEHLVKICNKIIKNPYKKVNSGLQIKRDKILEEIQSINIDETDIKNQILDSQLPLYNKAHLIQDLENQTSDKFKLRTYIKRVLKLPQNQVTQREMNKEIFLTRLRKNLDECIYGHTRTKEEIMDYVIARINNPNGKSTSILALHSEPGLGKCMKIDTPILMYDGSIKKIQDIQIGELLMGDDSSPREVLSLARGKDLMYDIIPVKGEKYTVNQEHILCLKYSGKPRMRKLKSGYFSVNGFFDNKISTKCFPPDKEEDAMLFCQNNNGKILEISVKEYLKLPDTIKKKLKGYRVPIEFQEKRLDIDPYMIGYWLGDGESRSSGISTQDSTVVKYFKMNLQKYNCYLNFTRDVDYRINGTGGKHCNLFLNTLKKYDLLNNKHIPEIYKCNSRENRLKLLAGLIDSDGSYVGGCYDFIQKSEKLLDDVVYLCRSLGFACYKSKQKKSCWYKNEYKENYYYRIAISGDISEIPVLCPRKKATKRIQIKDVLKTGIRVKEVGYDNYYGFTISGNSRYVIGDFTVTHNTRFIRALGKSLNLPFNQISLGGMSDASILSGHDYTYIGSKPGKIYEAIVKSNCTNGILYFDELCKIPEDKNTAINGVLTHILDPEQNSEFYDNYIGNVPIDLSKMFFILSFNDITKVDPIILNRLKVIKIKEPKLSEKVEIVKLFSIPELTKNINLSVKLTISDQLIKYIINVKTKNEAGMRNINRNIGTIIAKVNFLKTVNNFTEYSKSVLTKDFTYEKMTSFKIIDNTFTVTKEFIDISLGEAEGPETHSYSQMYI